ncbi:uncharacterized protein L203_101130 [Cryptococcus depauperatus CBS 7841]|uniref:Uncharacterized protein n=1 Tax=Cryptococcus depauperatus CBS 7841 TaxID=1295531 RepID=A0A1E3IKN4_9TREE|nr:hypothetical protein L203_02401 [Cryptococcus depauperatus CBS 7841]
MSVKRQRSVSFSQQNALKRSRITPSHRTGFFGFMGSLLRWTAREPNEEPPSDGESEQSESQDPPDSIQGMSANLSFPDPPSPISPPSPSSSTDAQGNATCSQRRRRRRPMRPNRDAYSQSNSFTWSSTIESPRRPLWYDASPRSLTTRQNNRNQDLASQRVMSMFSGRQALDRRRSLRRIDESIKGIRKVLQNDQATKELDDIVSKPKSGYKPRTKREIGVKAKEQASKPSRFELFSVLKNLKELHLQKEALLRPSKVFIPTKLNPQQERTIDQHLSNPSFKKVVPAAEITSSSLKRLKPNIWLDDEVINGYCDLMVQRLKGERGDGRKVHFLNSFFYVRLADKGYESARLRRWTKKVDIFSLDILFFPINLGNLHWTCLAINFPRKRIEYYDSMGDYGNSRKTIFKNVREYLDKESRDKKGKPMDLIGWVDIFNKNTPQQDNGSDCGVFTLQTLEALTRGRDLVENGFEFTAKNMPFFRRLMVWEIGEGRLEKRDWGEPVL